MRATYDAGAGCVPLAYDRRVLETVYVGAVILAAGALAVVAVVGAVRLARGSRGSA